jgi:hypothetical protein
MSAIRSPFTSQLIKSNFSNDCLSPLFTLIALGDVDLRFSLILITKNNVAEWELYQPHDYITSIINPHT